MEENLTQKTAIPVNVINFLQCQLTQQKSEQTKRYPLISPDHANVPSKSRLKDATAVFFAYLSNQVCSMRGPRIQFWDIRIWLDMQMNGCASELPYSLIKT